MFNIGQYSVMSHDFKTDIDCNNIIAKNHIESLDRVCNIIAIIIVTFGFFEVKNVPKFVTFVKKNCMYRSFGIKNTSITSQLFTIQNAPMFAKFSL